MSYEDYSSDQIYGTVPEKAKRGKKGDKSLIMSLLKTDTGHYFPAKQLALNAGYNVKGSQVELRKAITELIELDGHAIISSDKGFCLAEDRYEIARYLDSLNNRILGIQRRFKALQKHLE